MSEAAEFIRFYKEAAWDFGFGSGLRVKESSGCNLVENIPICGNWYGMCAESAQVSGVHIGRDGQCRLRSD